MDELSVIAEIEDDQIKRLNEWKDNVVNRGTHTHTQHTTVLRLCGICPGKPG